MFVVPNVEQEWLEAKCRANGWEHEESPLVWRELVHQGGTGMLIGGLIEFEEHCEVGIQSHTIIQSIIVFSSLSGSNFGAM